MRGCKSSSAKLFIGHEWCTYTFARSAKMRASLQKIWLKVALAVLVYFALAALPAPGVPASAPGASPRATFAPSA